MAVYQILTLLMMVAALYAIFFHAPIEKTMGIVQKIFYIHLPSAFLSFFSFFITFLASILYLYKKDSKWDIIAYCSVEIGVIFCSIVLITGPIWARPIWNVWWTWDPRLTTTLVLWFIYVAYLMFRGVVGENQRANFSAVFGIIGFVNVPITFFAVRLWRSIHPVVISAGGMNISTPMQQTLILTFIAFCLFFFYLLMCRIRLEKARVNLEKIKDIMQDRYHPE
jgi:heme exporter protein C